jgi:hypothetical protein
LNWSKLALLTPFSLYFVSHFHRLCGRIDLQMID